MKNLFSFSICYVTNILNFRFESHIFDLFSHFRYSLHLPTQSIPSFTANMAITLCIESSCQYVSMFESFPLPTYSCSEDDILVPGDGTINGLLTELRGNIGDVGKMLLLNSLDWTVSCLLFCSSTEF